jgi:hypothetical protein
MRLGAGGGWQNRRHKHEETFDGRHDPQRPGLRDMSRPQAGRDLLIKGLMLVFIGGGVLLAPLVVHNPATVQAVGGAALVGWFALVLGVAFLGLWLRRRLGK